jgi:hypothetical protein
MMERCKYCEDRESTEKALLDLLRLQTLSALERISILERALVAKVQARQSPEATTRRLEKEIEKIEARLNLKHFKPRQTKAGVCKG